MMTLAIGYVLSITSGVFSGRRGGGGGATHSMHVVTTVGLPAHHFWDFTASETGLCVTTAPISGCF